MNNSIETNYVLVKPFISVDNEVIIPGPVYKVLDVYEVNLKTKVMIQHKDKSLVIDGETFVSCFEPIGRIEEENMSLIKAKNEAPPKVTLLSDGNVVASFDIASNQDIEFALSMSRRWNFDALYKSNRLNERMYVVGIKKNYPFDWMGDISEGFVEQPKLQHDEIMRRTLKMLKESDI